MGEIKLFESVYEYKPKTLAFLLKKEAAITKAFVLSFAPNTEYIEEVLDIYHDTALTELVKDYLSHIDDENYHFSPEIAREIERVLEKILSESIPPA
jgi:flagellar motor switch protein FliG